MRLPRILLAMLLLTFLAPSAFAQDAADAPQVEVTLDPTDGVTVGTPVRITLSVLTPNYLVQPPDWPDMQIADAITRTPANAARPASRRIGGQTWTVVSRIYEITAQRAADYALEPHQITLTYADPQTNQPVPATVEIPAISFTASVPKGAEGLSPFVAADALAMTQTVEGPGDDARPGSAVTRTLTIEAQGTQSMLLPALLGGDPPPGLRAYPREPELSDEPGQRGGPDIARRVESITYVAEAPGDYALPEVRLDWWNSPAAQVESATAKGISFSIPAPPGWHPPGTPDPRLRALSWAAGIGALVLALLWLGRRPARAALVRLSRSEPVMFRRLLRQTRRGDPGAIRAALADWLDRIGATGTPAGVADALTLADREIWGPEGTRTHPSDTSRRALAQALRAARHDLLHRRKAASAPALPPLNPW
ncbi:hypothetical protein ACHFJ0_20460 [Paracoccus sp. NGMCC 1.201697]|uniref:Oxygen tolerance protein BatD n=1 Tax=Paracoccus broussonetiae subsp. drimophilus TaxID=3373869 RepID=A0ABW7LSG6_9RHOB